MHTPSTAKAYARDIDKYLLARCGAAKASYGEVLSYLNELRAKQSRSSVHRQLQSIKKYYDYLLATDQREDHPCSTLYLRDRRGKEVQLQDLFTEVELQSLLEREERYGLCLRIQESIGNEFTDLSGLDEWGVDTAAGGGCGLGERGTIYSGFSSFK